MLAGECGVFCCDEEQEGKVKLTGGRKPSEGYVEMCVRQNNDTLLWGTLCDDHWDNRDAGVICSMLGYHRQSEIYYIQHKHESPVYLIHLLITSVVDAIASKFSRFVPDPDNTTLLQQKVVLGSIHCEGHENSLSDCPTVSSEDCYKHIEDAGVICEGMISSSCA